MSQPKEGRLISPDMGAVYDRQAEAFYRFSRTSPTWIGVEGPAYDKRLRGFYNGQTQVLDAGCGSGRIAEHLVARGVAPANIFGIDISNSNIQIAKREVPGPRYLVADMRSVTLPPESVDLVTAHMLFEFLDPEGLQKVLQKFHQTLRKGGTLVYITTHPDSMPTQQGWYTRRSPWETGMEIQNYSRSKDDFTVATENAGFHNVESEELSMPPEAEADVGEKYAKYASEGNLRLLVKAQR